ncbi:MAG: MBL fold metallo-hydrolase [Thermoleophilia bacterium]|nr:MBL fold metallo-hydrolase [Thermoleophilia bacterium]
MIVLRSMHKEWLSNSFLVADQPGGYGVIVDAGAPIEPLMGEIEKLDLGISHVVLTHEHQDHTVHMVELQERYGAEPVTPSMVEHGYEVVSGRLTLRALATPGHCTPHFSWLGFSGDASGAPDGVFTGDVLFKGSIGGTVNGGPNGFAELKASLLEQLLTLPPETIAYPGHMMETTIGRENEHNPFVRALRGEIELGDEPVTVAGQHATLLLMAPDYVGKKAWVRFADGRDAIVGGGMVTRA